MYFAALCGTNTAVQLRLFGNEVCVTSENDAQVGDRLHDHQDRVAVIPKVNQRNRSVAAEADRHVNPHQAKGISIHLVGADEQQTDDDHSDGNEGDVSDQTHGGIEGVVDPVVLGKQKGDNTCGEQNETDDSPHYHTPVVVQANHLHEEEVEHGHSNSRDHIADSHGSIHLLADARHEAINARNQVEAIAESEN